MCGWSIGVCLDITSQTRQWKSKPQWDASSCPLGWLRSKTQTRAGEDVEKSEPSRIARGMQSGAVALEVSGAALCQFDSWSTSQEEVSEARGGVRGWGCRSSGGLGFCVLASRSVKQNSSSPKGSQEVGVPEGVIQRPIDLSWCLSPPGSQARRWLPWVSDCTPSYSPVPLLIKSLYLRLSLFFPQWFSSEVYQFNPSLSRTNFWIFFFPIFFTNSHFYMDLSFWGVNLVIFLTSQVGAQFINFLPLMFYHKHWRQYVLF